MKKIRVLHVIKTLSLGGAEINLLNLVQAFDPDLVECHIGYSWGGEIEPRFKSAGIRLIKYSEGSHKIKSFATPLIVLKLAAYILSHRIDVVHTHVFNAHVWAGMAARLTGRPVVEHVHDMRYVTRADRDANNCHVDQFKYAGFIKNLSDEVIVLTQQNKDYIVKEKMHTSDRVQLIRNGIRLNNENQSGKSLRSMEGRIVFLTPVRISAEKNIDLIFKIAPRVAKECPSVLFLIAGDGPMLNHYKRRVVDEGLKRNLRLLGFQKNIQSLLSQSYALLLPSFIELHPIAILEALSMRVPVVVSADVGCNSEIFTNGKNALLRDPYKPDEWADALIRLIREPELRNMLGNEGFKLCRNEFDIRSIAQKIGSVYESLAR